MAAPRMLVCDDEAGLRETLKILFTRSGFDVETAEGVRDALARMGQSRPFDLVVTDLSMPDGSGMQVLEAARAADASTQVIMITAYATTDQAVQAMRQGAYDYLQKPFDNDALRATADKAMEKRHLLRDNRELRAQVQHAYGTGELIGKSPAMARIRELVSKVGPVKSNVLITGESGTGKEVVARALHGQSQGATDAFIVVNCGALPEALMESELFGHEKGAFSGAVSRQEGLVRASDGGTLFLDEVGELPLPLQVKLLRVLQERRVRPVGGSKELPVNLRVVAATNRDLEAEVQAGQFRQDLFYRLNVIRIAVPALRARREDIPVLATHLLTKHCGAQGKDLEFSQQAMRWLLNYEFPGNVRELENLIERAVTLANGRCIEEADMPDRHTEQGSLAGASGTVSLVPDAGFDLDAHLAQVEKQHLLNALTHADGNRTAAAKLLGMTFRSFRYRLAKWGFDEATRDAIALPEAVGPD